MRKAIALAFAFLLTGCVQQAFYYPDSRLYDRPSSAGLAYEDVTFRSADGTRLSGWFIPAIGEPHATVVHFHGNARNISAHWRLVGWLPRRGFNVFVFDYRGYGTSDGAPEPRGLFEDSNAALDYVRTRRDVDPSRLVVLGQSLGGANAIAAVGAGNRAGVRAVAVEATFYSYSSIAHDTLPGAGLLVDDAYSPARYVAGVSPIPLLLMHGTADGVIPYAHAGRLFAAAREPKRLVTIENAGHTQAFAGRYGARYEDLLVEFFESALARAR